MSDPTRTSSGSPFWQFSLRFYRQPGVAQACLALQDHAGVDVNLLLFLLWLAGEGRELSRADVAALEARIAPWREGVVIPLRNLRRALKSPPDLVTPDSAEGLRTRIKAVELESERLQQEAMFALASPVLGRQNAAAASAAAANIAAYQAVRGSEFAFAAVEALLRGLELS